jgi:hypothetical protein
MNPVSWKEAGLLLVGVIAGLSFTDLGRASSLTAQEVMSKAVAKSREQPEHERDSNFTYTKVTVTEELDPSGKIKDQKKKVWQVSLESGRTTARLLAVNGRPPHSSDLKKQNEHELSLRQLFGSQNASTPVDRDSFLTAELVDRFDFTLTGEPSIDGRKAFQIDFQPKTPEPPVRRLIDRLLNQISGTLWIDAEEFELAKVQINLRSEVDLLGGVVGCLKKMAYTLTRVRIAQGIWVNSAASGDFEGRKLLDSMRVRTTSQCSDFKRLSAD